MMPDGYQSPLFGLPQRLPPANVEAECAFLGALLHNNKVLDRVPDLDPVHFAHPANARIFSEMKRLIGAGRVADAVTLKSVFENADILDDVGGTAYLVQLLSSMVGIINAGDYARVIRDCWVRREMIEAGERLVNSAFGEVPDAESSAIAAEAIARIDAAVGGTGTLNRSITTLDSAMDAAIAAMEAAQDRKGPAGVSTGFQCIDARLGGLEPGHVYVIAGRPGMGKEQPVDTPILTPDGWVKMGDLIVGNFVIGRDGKPTRIIAVHDQGEKQAFRVSFRDGTSVECGENHLWSVAASSGRSRLSFKVLSTRKLLDSGICAAKQGGRVGAKWRIPLVSPIEFPERNLPVDPYILGVLIGDGAVSGRDFRFSNPDMDGDIRVKVAARLPPDIGLTENRSNSCPYYSLRGAGLSRYKNALISMGLRVKSQGKFIPEIYKFSSSQQRMDLLHGLMDTDGSCLANRSVFYTTSSTLAGDVCALVRSLGGVAIMRQYDRSKDGKPIEYCVNVKVAEAPFSTARKLAQWSPHSLSKYIRSILPSRIVRQRCITVAAADGLYVTDDYIVTHNSALAAGIAINAARAGVGVLELSLEMSATQLGRRALCAASGVSLFNMKTGYISNEHGVRLVAARKELAGLPLTIDDAGGQTPAMIAAKARAAKRKHGLGLLMIDHLNLMRAEESDARHGGTWATGRASNTVLQIAKDCACPVLLLAQLNRGPESRDDKRPTLSDLRQAGDIEQDAYAVGFVYRPEYYLGGEPEQKDGEAPGKYRDRIAEWETRKRELAGVAELIWAKVRDGEPGTDRLTFHGPTTSFGEPG